MTPFVSLANHSHYSLLDSTLSPAAIVQMAVAYGMPAVGLTDTAVPETRCQTIFPKTKTRNPRIL